MAVQPWQTSFTRVVRDVSRDRLDPRNGHCYNLVDWIPNLIDAPLAKRGGTVYVSELLSGTHAGADRVAGLIFGDFTTSPHLVAITVDDGGGTGRCVIPNSVSSTTDRGDCPVPRENPILYRNRVYIASSTSSTAPYQYDGNNNAALVTGSPPQGKSLAVYKDHLVIANNTAEPQRVWFSAAGDPTSWDTTNGFINTSGDVSVMWALRNALLIFHRGSLERIIGSIPPPGTDMSLQVVWDQGCQFPYSLAGNDEFVVFANTAGLWKTDGTEPVDLTKAGGMKSYWVSRFAASGNRIVSGGFYRGKYFCTISHASPLGDFHDAFMVDVNTAEFTRLSNFEFNCYTNRFRGVEELYAGGFLEPRVHSLSDIFIPASANKNDADGTAILPIIEGAVGIPSIGLQTIRNMFVRYDIRDSASDNPTLTLSYLLDPTSSSYTAVVGNDGNAYPLPETTAPRRVKRKINKSDLWLGWKIAQTNASAQTRLYQVDWDGEIRDPARV